MQRRSFLAATLAALPVLHARAHEPRRIALVGALTRDFDQQLSKLGFAPDRDVRIERPQWDFTAPDVRRILGEVVRARADVIVSCGALPTQAALEATRSIPIVMVYGGDPVAMKLAASFSRPGGNLTGLAWSASDSIAAKAAELFREAVPGAKAFGVLGYAENPGHQWLAREASDRLPKLGLRCVEMLLRGKEDLDATFHTALQEGIAGVIAIPDHLTRSMGRKIIALGRSHRIPTLWGLGMRPQDGELLTFGPDVDDHERRAADYVAKILRGARPGDLAIEQTTRVKLGVNLKAAQAFGLQLPASLVVRADEVIR